jgi:hypothetical protein
MDWRRSLAAFLDDSKQQQQPPANLSNGDTNGKSETALTFRSRRPKAVRISITARS